MMDEFIFVQALPSLVSKVWWNIVMDDWILDDNTFAKWLQLQHYKFEIPPKHHKEWHIMLG